MRTRTARPGSRGPSLIHAALAAAIAACLPVSAASAQTTPASDAAWDFAIPAGELEAALDRFSTQTGLQLAYRPDVVAGRRVAALTGRLTWREALARLLRDSGLEYVQANDRSVVIRVAEPAAAPAARPPQPSSPPPAARAEPRVTDVDTMTVTGTRIRGGSTPSPVTTISAQQIQQEGFSDLGELVRSIPQNFSGGQNPEVPSGNLLQAGVANQNVTGGSGLNLRGLGPDATLTLLNGRRMSYSGFSQALDISAIPVEAVDRIEIVPDGASAIYGSDAVAGVGNVILRRDFEGVTLGARYGVATEGGLETREYTATGGVTWASGGLIAAYKNVSADPIYARQRDYTSYLAHPATIYPRNDLRSGLFSLHQSIGDVAELHFDALRSSREQTNSFFLSTQPQYYKIMPETTGTWVSPGMDFYLPNDWSLSVDATWGKDESNYFQTVNVIATGQSTTLYDYCFCNELRTYEVGAEGPLFTLPGGADARLALGVGHRSNEFRQAVKQGSGVLNLEGSEGSRFAYAEINLPFISPESGIAGANRLLMTAAARSESYDSYGRVTTPQLGLIYSPTKDFSLKGAWGKSFKAPTLYQNYITVTALLYPATTLGGVGYPADATVMYLQGGNRNLRPERAKTWTASLAFHPTALPGLQAELTWFDIDYTDRVVFPFANVIQGLSDPIYAPFVEYSPSAESQSNAIASAGNFINASGRPYDPAAVVAILHGRFTNTVQQHIRGADLSGSYRFDAGAGELTIRGSASWIDSSQQLSEGQPSVDLSGTRYNPAKVHSRLGLVWTQGGLSASAFVNYISAVRNRVSGVEGASSTTLDATIRYSTGQGSGGWSGLDVALAVQNLLNREPPLYTPANTIYATPYDPTNYSAIGRFLSLSITKHW